MSKPDPLDFMGLPQSLSAERMILGGIINQSLDFHTGRAILSTGDFALETHRTIYNRIEQMCEAGIAIDYATVTQELTNHNELESIGGMSCLVELDTETPHLAQ